MRILLLEDEPDMTNYLEQSFSASGWSVDACDTIGAFRDSLELLHDPPDLVVLDRLVGGMDASTFIPKIRRRWPATKILVLSAIGTSAEKSRVLDIGADEYVSKPFSIEELGARIRAVMRRAEQDSGLYCRLGNIVLLLPSHSTQIDGVSVDLSRKEYQLLRTFMGTPTRVFSKFQLLDLVWGVNSEVESNVVEGTLLNLRKKLARAGARPRIMNRRLVGYWIEE